MATTEVVSRLYTPTPLPRTQALSRHPPRASEMLLHQIYRREK
jgi:hypothetical protein